MKAALYDVRIEHVRTEPLRNAFRYRSYLWLVDVDAAPVPPRGLGALAVFSASDHFGDPAATIRQNVTTFCRARGIEVTGEIRMLTHARVLGYVFNPLSVFWCHDATGQLLCTIAEVHNTYGERHCYLLRPDERGRAVTEKEFYVSPFYPVDGRYQMSVPEPAERLDVTIVLHRDGARPFVASMRGRRLPATGRALVRLALRHPMAPLVGALRIRRQGVGLWLRGLRPSPRPVHHQEGVR